MRNIAITPGDLYDTNRFPVLIPRNSDRCTTVVAWDISAKGFER